MLATLYLQGRTSPIVYPQISRIVNQQEKWPPSRWEEQQVLAAFQMTPKQRHMRRQSRIFSWEVLVPRAHLVLLFWMGNDSSPPKKCLTCKIGIDMDVEESRY